jgi:DNA polymerase I-like protein with 3'-5' exonuclease and polymerase domains
MGTNLGNDLGGMMQRPLFDPRNDWKPTPPGHLPSWAEAKRVAVDLETCDPELTTLGIGVRRGGYIAGIAFAIDGGPSHYLPVAHEGGGNLRRSSVLAYLRKQAKAFKGDIVGANLAYDLDYLAEAGVWFGGATFRDVQLAAPLLDENQMRYNLEVIGQRLGLGGKAEEELRDAAAAWGLDPKAELYKLPSRHVARYAIQDVELPLAILRRQEIQLERENLGEVWELESRALPVLLKMRRRGVLIDQKRLEAIERRSLAEETRALEEVHAHTGIRIEVGDVWRPEPIADALAVLGVKVPKTKTGKPSTKSDIVDKVDHDAARAILKARKWNKLRTTFAASIRRFMTNGRIHCTFNQLRAEKGDGGLKGTVSGRLSSDKPNLQQQPARDKETGPLFRSIYLPEPGKVWAALDYSQQEPRMVVHYAVKSGCKKAEQAAERYRNDPNADNHQMMADLAGIERKPAKAVFLGLCYGMGGAKLCKQLGLPTRRVMSRRQGKMIDVAGPEGQALLDKFDRKVPFVRELAKRAEARAKSRGFIRTISGRRCRFPKDARGRYDWTYKALNRLIQGSSADQTKAAMVAADAAGFALQLQVHDEIDFSVSSKAEAEACGRVMETCIPLEVPSKVDVEIGKNWGDSM